jgi:hypothetical protein
MCEELRRQVQRAAPVVKGSKPPNILQALAGQIRPPFTIPKAVLMILDAGPSPEIAAPGGVAGEVPGGVVGGVLGEFLPPGVGTFPDGRDGPPDEPRTASGPSLPF